jgi:endonuclease/exonuclease/phosphatase family metal-dependent hydrolase
MTYNIHHGRGRDGRVDLDRICAAIQEGKPDLVSLQEVDLGMTRSGWIDQGQRIADLLQMRLAAGHNWFLGEGAFGNILLSRWPITLFGNLDLSVPRREPRGLLLAEVQCPGALLLVGALHLGLGWAERKRQCLKILEQLQTLYPNDPILLMGDFNSLPFSSVSRRFRKVYADAFKMAGTGRGATYRGMGLPFRIDDIYATEHLFPLSAFALRTGASGIASDHFPLVGRFLWNFEHGCRNDSQARKELLSGRLVRSD